MSEIRVVYFDLRARGEPIRLVLEAAGKKYEDVRIPFDDWPAGKENTPYGQLPYVEYKGKKYGQSVALASFFAREFGLYGKSNTDTLRVDEVVGLGLDLQNALYSAKFESDEAKKEEMFKKQWDETVPKNMEFFQKLLQENNNSGFFVGSTVTLADLFTYNLCDALIAEKEDIAKTFPAEVKKLRSTVEAHPFIRSYLAKRKKVPF